MLRSLLWGFLFMPVLAGAQDTAYLKKIIPLYPDTIPNRIIGDFKDWIMGDSTEPYGYLQTDIPTLTAYLPSSQAKSNLGIIVVPGGAYRFLAFYEEGTAIARYFARHGIAAFVLKYRLPSDKTMKDKSIGPLQDLQQAILQVRSHAADWKIDSGRIGVMGFSAGGHLAATAQTHFTKSYIANPAKVNLRPDYSMLVYPVISMTDSLTHPMSRNNLLGAGFDQAAVENFSNELQVTANTPPTWIIVAGDDKLVNVNNSIVFYQALQRHGVPADMHIYPKGDHGFVLKMPQDDWLAPLLTWLREFGYKMPEKH